MKKLVLIIMTLLMSTGVAFAEQVTVEGYGIDRNSALRDAQRVAVEQVAGTLIDSRTLVTNAVTAFDEISSKATGFVRGSSVLSEGNMNGSYYVKAVVDVDTSPNAALISQLQAVMGLNDPRILVVALNNGVHDDYIEESMNERLIDMGFSHVVEANMVSALHNAPILDQLYSGRPVSYQSSGSLGADFAVIGKINTEAKGISIPDFRGGTIDTQMVSGKAEMIVKIIKLATGELIETFTVDGSGIQLDNSSAANKARGEMATKAASKLEAKFKKLGAKSSNAYQMIAYTMDYSKVEQLAADLKGIAGVGNVYIREYNGRKAIIEFDSAQTPATVNQMLRNSSRLSLRVESSTGSSISYIVN